MRLKSIEDYRSRLDKATRYELYQFAQARGVKEIVHEMPASLMRDILARKGLTDINIPRRDLGAYPRRPGQSQQAAPSASDKVVSVNAAADLARQWQQQQAAPPPPPQPPAKRAKPDKPKRLVERPKSEINRLRDECKRLGIKMERRDRMPDLKAKIEAHGSNASNSSQPNS